MLLPYHTPYGGASPLPGAPPCPLPSSSIAMVYTSGLYIPSSAAHILCLEGNMPTRPPGTGPLLPDHDKPARLTSSLLAGPSDNKEAQATPTPTLARPKHAPRPVGRTSREFLPPDLYLTPRLDELPLTFSNDTLARYALWRAALYSDGRIKKIATGGRDGRWARSNDPDTWIAYPLAARALQRADTPYAGLARLLWLADGMTVLDFDHVVDRKTGAIEPRAWEIIQRCNSYTELSPSRDGVHVWVTGTVAAALSLDWLQVYSHAHYMTLTGWRVPGTPSTVEYRQDVLDALDAELRPTKVVSERRATPKPSDVPQDDGPLTDEDKFIRDFALSPEYEHHERFARLWAGDWAGRYPSQSEADMTFMNFLAGLCHDDPWQMDRLMRGSGLMRDRWDWPSGEGTYGQRTIRKAITH